MCGAIFQNILRHHSSLPGWNGVPQPETNIKNFPPPVQLVWVGRCSLFWLAFIEGTPFRLDELGDEDDLELHTIWLRNMARPGRARIMAHIAFQFIALLWSIVPSIGYN